LEPPFCGVAVYVTDCPEQIDVAVEVIVTPTADGDATVIVIEFDVAGFPEGQLALEVIRQWIISPFTGL
jgi:hypothetical protein